MDERETVECMRVMVQYPDTFGIPPEQIPDLAASLDRLLAGDPSTRTCGRSGGNHPHTVSSWSPEE